MLIDASVPEVLVVIDKAEDSIGLPGMTVGISAFELLILLARDVARLEAAMSTEERRDSGRLDGLGIVSIRCSTRFLLMTGPV